MLSKEELKLFWQKSELDITEFAEKIWEAAVLAEREACAKVCDDLIGTRAYAVQCAAAIRARGEK